MPYEKPQRAETFCTHLESVTESWQVKSVLWGPYWDRLTPGCRSHHVLPQGWLSSNSMPATGLSSPWHGAAEVSARKEQMPDCGGGRPGSGGGRPNCGGGCPGHGGGRPGCGGGRAGWEDLLGLGLFTFFCSLLPLLLSFPVFLFSFLFSNTIKFLSLLHRIPSFISVFSFSSSLGKFFKLYFSHSLVS